MTERQLLERAARAAGYTIRFHNGVCKGGAYEGCERLWPDGEWRAWRPREDDGDALRLLVACSLLVDASGESPCASSPFVVSVAGCRRSGDRDSQARHAIFQAAAAMTGGAP